MFSCSTCTSEPSVPRVTLLVSFPKDTQGESKSVLWHIFTGWCEAPGITSGCGIMKNFMGGWFALFMTFDFLTFGLVSWYCGIFPGHIFPFLSHLVDLPNFRPLCWFYLLESVRMVREKSADTFLWGGRADSPLTFIFWLLTFVLVWCLVLCGGVPCWQGNVLTVSWN